MKSAEASKGYQETQERKDGSVEKGEIRTEDRDGSSKGKRKLKCNLERSSCWIRNQRVDSGKEINRKDMRGFKRFPG